MLLNGHFLVSAVQFVLSWPEKQLSLPWGLIFSVKNNQHSGCPGEQYQVI